MNNDQNRTPSVRGRRYQPRRGRGRGSRNRRVPGGEPINRLPGGSQQSASTADKTRSLDGRYVQQLCDRNRNRFSSGADGTRNLSSLRTKTKEPSPTCENATPLDNGNIQDFFTYGKNQLSVSNNLQARKAPIRPTIPLDLVGQGNNDKNERKIGVGFATGFSRVPEKELSDSPQLVRCNLRSLGKRIEELLRRKNTVLDACNAHASTSASEHSFDDWGAIHGAFRQLTMSITASTNPEVKQLAIPVYESAADASLYGGNLSFYLSCQTRLLKELYAELSVQERKVSRYSEFIGYSLLYFGVFHVDNTEIAQLMRSMDGYARKDSSVRVAFSILLAIRRRDGRRLFDLYRRCDVRQRVLVFPALGIFRRQVLSVLIRAYMQLSKSKTVSILGTKSESETLALLAEQRPDLAAQTKTENEEYSFRISL